MAFKERKGNAIGTREPCKRLMQIGKQIVEANFVFANVLANFFFFFFSDADLECGAPPIGPLVPRTV